MQLTAEGILHLFRCGLDTADIAERLDIPEAAVYNALAARMRWPEWVRKAGHDKELSRGRLC